MSEYQNSIRNNMVNTEYKINITSVPEKGRNYRVQREESHKYGNIVIAVILAASLAWMTAVTIAQNKSHEQNSAVVATEVLPGGGTLNVTENPTFSYFVTPSGERASVYNGINASDLAQSYQNSAPTMGK